MVYSLPNNPLGYDDARLWKREYGYGLGKRMGADLPYLGESTKRAEDYGLWPSVDYGAGKRNIGDDLPKSEDVEKRGEGYGYGLGKRWTNWGYKPNYITWSTLGKLGKRNKGYREFAPQEYEKRNLIQLPEDDYQAYEPQVPAYQDPNQILFKRMNRKKELKNLYGRIAEKFPFLAKQGLKGDSLDDLFGMTIFGQPKAGK